ncbi:MalY/PatB family protein [Marinilabilia sp.]
MYFDKKIDRSGTNALKLEFRNRVFGTNDVIPLWVADMDFAVPEVVSKAIQKRAEHPIFGYTARDDAFYQSIQEWQKNQHDWEVSTDWLEYMPGVVPTLILAIRAFSNSGDKVVIQPPVYPPFFDVIKDHERIIEENPLVDTPDGYRMDFDHLQKLTTDPKVKMLLLCHPHNPVGRVWTKSELTKMGEICLENNVMVVSDEIHADLVHKGHRHIPFASLRADFAANSVTCMAPSKTFNIAGLNTSYIIAPDEKIRRAMQKQLQAYHLFTGNMFGAEALKAAYTSGKAWLNELLEYLQGNIDYVMDFVAENMPEVKIHKPEATYLMWLDFSQWGVSDANLRKFIIEKAGIGLNYGPTFGKDQGANFHRLNVASSRQVIEEAMTRLLEARNTIAE